MAKQKSSSQPSEPAEEMASDVAEVAALEPGHAMMLGGQPVTKPDAPISSDDVVAYRQDIAVDVFRALVHGMRIEVKHTDVPCDVAERTLKLHAELMKHAELAGIIAPVEPKDGE